MRFSFIKHAGDFEVFARDAFTNQVGQEVRVNLPDGRPVTGTLAAAQVAEDRRSVELTIEIPDGLLRAFEDGQRYGQGFSVYPGHREG